MSEATILEEAKSAPGWPGKEYPTRPAGWHMRCCQAFGVSVVRESEFWWRASAYSAEGTLLYATGGRTRRHAETNALNGAGAPMRGSGNTLMQAFDDGPS